MELARHSDIRLTMNVYTHAGLYDLASAVESLPALLPAARQTTLAATGTENGAPTSTIRVVHRVVGADRISTHSTASAGIKGACGTEKVEYQETPKKSLRAPGGICWH